MTIKIKSMMGVAALALTGCAPMVTQSSLSHSNPANPNAAEASYPAAAPILMTGTNIALNAQAEKQPTSGHEKMEMDMPMKH